MIRLALVLLAVLAYAPAWAHKPSDSYLTLEVKEARVEGRWDMALRDLDVAIGLDADGDGQVTWGELRTRHADLAAHALGRLTMTADGRACPARVTGHEVENHGDGAYAVLRFAADCPGVPGRLAVTYSLFFDQDPTHRGLASLTGGGSTQAVVFSPDQPTQDWKLGEAPGAGKVLADYGREGVWHIAIGFDHILFLVSLLLPAVLIRDGRTWRGQESWQSAAVEIVKVVTAFTVAHSITLTAAALGAISLPSRWVESAIALSVVLAALNNLYPILSRRRWPMAFAFGLVHGFGFASVLAELGLPSAALAWALLGFNLGVEVGQLAIVAVFFPIAYLLRDGVFYRRVVLTGGSVAIMAVAGVWFTQRALALSP